MKDEVLEQYYLESGKEAEKLQQDRDGDYNAADVGLEDYAGFAPAGQHHPTFWPDIWKKTLRYRSLFYSRASEGKLLDTLLDLQNYVRFETATIKKRRQGQIQEQEETVRKAATDEGR